MSRGSISPGQKLVIQKLILELGKQMPGLKVDEYPDKINRDGQDIDVIAGPFAIEHSSLDSRDEERRNHAIFSEIHPDDSILIPAREFSAVLKIRAEALFEIKTRGLRSVIKHQLSAFILNELSALPLGRHKRTFENLDVDVSISEKHTGKFSVRIARTFEKSNLLQRFEDLVTRKAEKLSQYKLKGKKTYLLIESEDNSLMSADVIQGLAAAAFKDRGYPSHLDKLWYINTSISGEFQLIDLSHNLVNIRQ